ncbi:MAG: phage holin family protein [Anaerotignaceae bacterium]
MVLDLSTKLFALSSKGGGLQRALTQHKISSSEFFIGTRDKLLVFGILMVIGGCAYRLTSFSEVGVWFTQLAYTLMFLRDLLSIIENLNDAGVGGLKIFEKAVKKKMGEYVDEEDIK